MIRDYRNNSVRIRIRYVVEIILKIRFRCGILAIQSATISDVFKLLQFFMGLVLWSNDLYTIEFQCISLSC